MSANITPSGIPYQLLILWRISITGRRAIDCFLLLSTLQVSPQGRTFQVRASLSSLSPGAEVHCVGTYIQLPPTSAEQTMQQQ